MQVIGKLWARTQLCKLPVRQEIHRYDLQRQQRRQAKIKLLMHINCGRFVKCTNTEAAPWYKHDYSVTHVSAQCPTRKPLQAHGQLRERH